MSAATPGRSREGQTGGRVRNLGLDVARSAAILMVLVSHLATSSGSLPPGWSTALDTMGQAGVELFFSLSGFLIGGILVRMSTQELSLKAVGRFMLRRWFRTLPLYTIVLAAAGAWFGMDIRHSLMLVQNFFPAEPRALPVSWSLVMEEYFYVAFPLLMLALHAAGVRGARLVGWTASGLIVGCAGLRLWNAYGFGPGWPAPFVHENPFLRLDCAAYGAVAAWLSAGRQSIPRVPGWVLVGAGLALAGSSTALLVWVLGTGIESLVAAGFLRWGPAFLALQTTGSDAGFALVVVGLAGRRLFFPQAVASAVTWISLVSYSIYLVHMPMIGLFARLSGTTGAVQALGAATGTIALSSVTYHAIERPFLKLRDAIAPDVS